MFPAVRPLMALAMSIMIAVAISFSVLVSGGEFDDRRVWGYDLIVVTI